MNELLGEDGPSSGPKRQTAGDTTGVVCKYNNYKRMEREAAKGKAEVAGLAQKRGQGDAK